MRRNDHFAAAAEKPIRRCLAESPDYVLMETVLWPTDRLTAFEVAREVFSDWMTEEAATLWAYWAASRDGFIRVEDRE